ncbi:MAG: LysE family translocator [Pseudomonadales bacterium]|nr:LysE family translocator [Pseudomonadales bacterium]
MNAETLIAFAGASAILALAPGPDNLFVLTQAALHGRRAGLLITLGLCSGLVLHTTAVALGVAAIFLVSLTAFTLLKLVGAAYLLYLAWQAWRASIPILALSQSPALSAGALYRRGVIMNLTNPKVAIFFLAFLPQFADPAAGALPLQLLLLGLIFIVVALLVFSGIATLAAWLARPLQRSPRIRLLLNRSTALVFAGLALHLASTSR